MQKFDVFAWEEIKTNEEIQVARGRLQLRLSTPCPVYFTAQGVEALIGFTSQIDVEVSEAGTVNVHAPKGARAFYHRRFPSSVEADGEVFTNIDRMPNESGMLAEVTRARRQLEIERRSMVEEIRREAAVARASLRPSNLDKPKSKAKPETAAEPDGEAAQADEAEGGEGGEE